MPGLGPGIHVLLCADSQDVDGRDKPGHDDAEAATAFLTFVICDRPAASGARERWLRPVDHELGVGEVAETWRLRTLEIFAAAGFGVETGQARDAAIGVA